MQETLSLSAGGVSKRRGGLHPVSLSLMFNKVKILILLADSVKCPLHVNNMKPSYNIRAVVYKLT